MIKDILETIIYKKKINKNKIDRSKIDKNKTLAFVCTSIDKMAGGLERQIIRTAKILSEEGFKVFLITYDNKNATSFYELPSHIKWVKCGCGLTPHKGAPFFKRLKQIFYLRNILLSKNITHLITFHHGLFPRSLLASIFLPIKNIISERNSLTNYQYIKLSKFNLGFLSMFFANKITVQLENYINDYPFLIHKKIIVAPNFINPPLPEKIIPNFYSKKVLMLGRLCPQKNFSVILDQIKLYNSDNFHVSIAGEGHLRKKFEIEYADLIRKQNISFCGKINNVDQFLLEGALFCFPSLWEGYPNSLVEALRVGLPVITTKRMLHLKSFVEHNVNGLVVEDSQIYNSISLLIDNPKILKRMGRQSKFKYKKLYSQNPKDIWAKLINNL